MICSGVRGVAQRGSAVVEAGVPTSRPVRMWPVSSTRCSSVCQERITGWSSEGLRMLRRRLSAPKVFCMIRSGGLLVKQNGVGVG